MEQVKDLDVKQEVWVRAWCAFTMSSNSVSRNGAIEWADSCLDAFKKRFIINETNN